MRAGFFLIFSITVLSNSNAHAESISGQASSAPTSFSNHIPLNSSENITDSVRSMPGIQVLEFGGLGKLQRFTLRGGRPNTMAITLEGIRLNSPSSGDFDLGLLSTFGIGSAQMLRGGYAPYSSSPNGQIDFRFPKEKQYILSLGSGMYDTYRVAAQVPHLSVSYEQAENDFPFTNGGIEQDRQNNASRRFNARAWYQWNLGETRQQAWAQILFNDLELPGDVLFPSPQAESKTFQPTAAYQGQSSVVDWDLWGSYQDQRFKDPDFNSKSTNRWYTFGLRLKRRQEVMDSLSLEPQVEWVFDKLNADDRIDDANDFKTPLRHSLAAVLGAYYTPWEHSLIHPRVRAEIITDLDDKFSIHPGIGGKHTPYDFLIFLWNFSWMSRAPNFNELYFELQPFSISNSDLDREQTLQFDLGPEFQFDLAAERNIRLRQAFFFVRTNDLLQTARISPSTTQVQNVGNSIAFGLENELEAQLHRHFILVTNYTIQRTSLGNNQLPQQSAHKLNIEAQLFPFKNFRLYIPLYYRSSLRSFVGGKKLDQQWDLGLRFIARIGFAELQLRAFNLLGWDRIEIDGFPLSNQPWYMLTAEARF